MSTLRSDLVSMTDNNQSFILRYIRYKLKKNLMYCFSKAYIVKFRDYAFRLIFSIFKNFVIQLQTRFAEAHVVCFITMGKT